MTAHGSHESVDELLRHVLLEARPVTGTPPDLRERVGRIPRDQGATRPVGEAQRWLTNAAGLAAVVALFGVAAFVVAVAGLSPLTSDLGGQGAPPPLAAMPFDPSRDGVGIVHNVGESLRVAPWLIATPVSACLLLLVVRRNRLWKAVAVAGTAVAFAAAHVVATQPGPAFGNASGIITGIRPEEPQPGSPGPSVYYVIAAPGDTFGVVMNIRNEGSLPIRLLGVVEQADRVERLHWTAVGTQRDPSGGVGPIVDAESFQPVDLGPGEWVNVYLVGRAGACAVGPTFEPSHDGSFSGIRIRLAFSVLGLTSTSEIEPHFVVVEPADESCPPLEEGQ